MINSADKAVLKALMSPFDELNAKQGVTTYKGFCQPATCVGKKVLTERRFLGKVWEYASGNFILNGVAQGGHAWLVSSDGQLLLDLTSNQFGVPGPLLITLPDPLDRYQTECSDKDGPCAFISSTWYVPVMEAFAKAGIAHPIV